MSNKREAPPKLFISYSWSSPEYEQKILDISTELCESGVDVKLDKWDLKEGQDAYDFMEQMVKDPEISKVAIFSDKTYAEKADSRTGGVGTETQIISKEVYDNQSQNKFVAVVMEKFDNGKPCVPTYYKSRKHIDLSEDDKYSESFEQLLRWIYDKPFHIKPKLGKMPSFLEEGDHISLGTRTAYKRCLTAIKNDKSYANGAFDEYCNIFTENLERFRMTDIEGEFDDALIENLEDFQPCKNEMVSLFIAIAQYSPSHEYIERIHRLFEEIYPYLSPPKGVGSYSSYDFDNFKFFLHELFLYALAVFIKYHRLDEVKILFEQQYYIPETSSVNSNAMVDYTYLWNSVDSLEYRKTRLKLNRFSLHADLLNSRSEGTGIYFSYLMQADFIAYMRKAIVSSGGWGLGWYPFTLVYLGRIHSTFEVFARSSSRTYFDKVKGLLGVNSYDDIEPLLKEYQNGAKECLRIGMFNSINPAVLMGYKDLCTQS